MPDCTLPAAPLLVLTGDTAKARSGWFASGLSRRIAEAWVVPAADLTCGQCRVLVGLRLGMEWLARPVARFVIDHPQAECDLYAGDLTVAALIVWRDMVKAAPDETMLMLAQDYDWLRREAQDDPWEGSILKQAVAALDEAES